MISLKYGWEHEYIAAILETDNEKLPIRIDEAKAVVLGRVERLNACKDEARDERISLANALAGLQKLKAGRLNYSALDGEWSR